MAGFSWGKFGHKQLYSIKHSQSRLNIWEGSVRSGKTIASIVRWIEYVVSDPKGDLLMFGKTERTLKRNILDVIESIIGEKNFKYNRGTGEVFIYGRRVYVAGASDDRAEGKIRGMTLAGAYGDELTLIPESFFKMLLSRLSVRNAKLFGTTNPDSPYHYLKREYIDNKELDCSVFHFELEDNPNLDKDYVASLKREYSGLWYKRFIKGEWVSAEGAIYDMWDDTIHVVTELPKYFERYYVGIDYGTSNPTVFLLIGKSGDRLYVIDEYYYNGRSEGKQKTDAEYSNDLASFISNYYVQNIVIDPSAASFNTQIRRDGMTQILHADNAVVDGIRTVASYLSEGKLFVYGKNCPNLIKEFTSYAWDTTYQDKGQDKPIKIDDHALDALRYVVHTLFKRSVVGSINKPKGW